jgi:hypothetical protein
MPARPLIVGAIVGGAAGALLTALATANVFPQFNFLLIPGVALLWSTSISWAGVIVVNAAVYAFLGVLVGLAIAFWRQLP